MKNKTETRVWTLHLVDRYYVDYAVCNSKNTVIVVPKSDADQREAELMAVVRVLYAAVETYNRVYDKMSDIDTGEKSLATAKEKLKELGIQL